MRDNLCPGGDPECVTNRCFFFVSEFFKENPGPGSYQHQYRDWSRNRSNVRACAHQDAWNQRRLLLIENWRPDWSWRDDGSLLRDEGMRERRRKIRRFTN